MFEVTNISNNPLQLSDGKGLAPGASRKLKSVTDPDRKYETRGWLMIVEEVKDKSETTEKTEAKK